MSKSIRPLRSWLASALVAVVSFAQANDLKVVAPNAVKESVAEVGARFEKETGHRVSFTWGGSEAIAKRVADGEVFDVVVTTASGVDRMLADGKLVAGSRTDFARSGVAVAARPGLPRPDVSTVVPHSNPRCSMRVRSRFHRAPAAATSNRCSRRLGVAEQIKHKIRQPPSGSQIGEMLARGGSRPGFSAGDRADARQGLSISWPAAGRVAELHGLGCRRAQQRAAGRCCSGFHARARGAGVG